MMTMSSVRCPPHGVAQPQFSVVVSAAAVHHAPSSLASPGPQPLVPDPYEATVVRVGTSSVPGGGQVQRYRVSHIIGPTLFLLFSRVLEHIQRNFS